MKGWNRINLIKLFNFSQIINVASFVILFISLIFKLVVEDYNKPVLSDVDHLINSITQKKSITYISNGVELKNTFKRHYIVILDMVNDKMYDEGMISKQAIKQNLYINEDVKVGYKTRCSFKDIKLAEEYMIDNYNYLVNLN